jgi:zinc transport system substrate-binding protein
MAQKVSRKYMKYRISNKEYRTAGVQTALPALHNSIFFVRYSAVQNHLLIPICDGSERCALKMSVCVSKSLVAVALLVLTIISAGCRESPISEQPKSRKSVITSDTILSGMSEALLPSDSFEIVAILPPGQCPGHYDIKLTDIAKVKRADLVISFRGMPFMKQTEIDSGKHLLIDTNGRNWMAPPSYIAGLGILADKLIERFPELKQQILIRKVQAVRKAEREINALSDKMRRAGVSQLPVIASSMLREPLEWMGLNVVGEYGRPEALSAKEIVRLTRIGKEKKAAMVVDNLQSGPEAGAGVAEALGVPHVILSNFPSEKGYESTISENANAVLTAARTK